MAISVKNISPEKLTSLLDWFSRNADEIYQNGTPGAKNVLDNALMRREFLPSPYSSRGFKGVLGESIDSVNYNPIYLGTDPDIVQDLANSIRTARGIAKYQGEYEPNTTNFLGTVVPDYTTASYLLKQLPLETPIPSAGLVRDFAPSYVLRPHNNTALGRWFNKRAQIDKGYIDPQDLPW
jgi:hypothetical protein